ncbi:MAG: hypothetical protein P8099_04780 [Gemmatimonadota bacterium]|jgi:1,4-dihydroxy-2-naphthoate octaprenyltransferase
MSVATRMPDGHGDPVGLRTWTASLLPALLGTTLPFWLRPPGFAFRWLPAAELVAAALLVHTGFSLLATRFRGRATADWTTSRLTWAAAACIASAGLLGLHLSAGLRLLPGVPDGVFILYGVATLFAGALYVMPPFSLWRWPGGEVVLAEGLGMMPVLGAYLVQAGDLTRTVYLASLPLVVATGLWVWTDELATRQQDETTGRGTMVALFPLRVSGRYMTLLLTLLLYATLAGAALGRASLPPLALLGLVSLWPALKVVAIAWNDYADGMQMLRARRYARLTHFVVGTVVVFSCFQPR